jgi:UDP-N-acetyl-D-glucosamine dehydrogenase
VAALPEGGLESCGFDEALTGADLALIITAHPGVDHDAIAERAPLVVDLRGVTRGVESRRTVLL